MAKKVRKTKATATTKPSGEAHLCASLRFPLEPLPASRPRVTRWGTYIAKPYKAWLDAANKYLKTVSVRIPPQHLTVHAEFVCTRARTSKLTTPKGDIDNYLKAPLDAITHAGLWEDDKWITTVVATKRFAEPDEEAHTRLDIYALPQAGMFERLRGYINRVLLHPCV